jgi:large subunit ribosomal protein L22
MEFRVKLSRAPFSARKGCLVVDLVRGKNVNAALEILKFTHKRPAKYLTKLLRSCIANVEYYNALEANRNQPKVDSDELVIVDVRADEGPLVGYRRRWRARSRGIANPINKRTCHLKLVLAEPPKEETKEEEKEAEETEKSEAETAEKKTRRPKKATKGKERAKARAKAAAPKEKEKSRQSAEAEEKADNDEEEDEDTKDEE